MKIANVDVLNLKEKYNTPLYIYDINHVKDNINKYKKSFKSELFETEIAYASKAFQIKEMLRIVKDFNIS